MTDTQWARVMADMEYLQQMLHGALASPLVWVPMALCVVAGAVFALRWFNERHSYTRVGRNASLACLALGCAIVAVGTWSHADTVVDAELPAARVSNDAQGALTGGQG
ncbi:hypothetical protein [uncultured Salinisphaera sp.]|uniref:hypothetical protein n=1 Tax=uncultured Salinisphaera sp. TaxID=359372 RepID=UPI0032B2E024|tara:strand:- start:663 stop:986 length:324 start_codon:yes stop_codon:yes gene_type:complete